MDFHMTDTGDIAISPSGDIAITDTNWRDFAQQAYLITMTAVSDFTLYPTLGTELENLIGMAQSPETGDYGKKLIIDALQANRKFSGIPIEVKAIPVSMQGIRFDIYLTIGSRTEMILSIEQNLGLDGDA